MTLLLSTALLGACKKTDTAATAPAGSTSTTTTTTTTPPSPAATGKTDSATTGAAASASPSADAAAAAANNAATAATGAATAAANAAGNTTRKAGDALGESAVTGKVKALLLADSEVKGTDINVETSNGVVMLSGFVESQAQINKAAKLAGGVEGVKSVSNKLEVKK